MLSKFKVRMKRWDDFMKKYTRKAIQSSNQNSPLPDVANDPLYRDADAMFERVQSALNMLFEENNEDPLNDHDDLCIADYVSDCESIAEDDAFMECDSTSGSESPLQKTSLRRFITDDCDSDEIDVSVEDIDDCEQTDSDYDCYQGSTSLVTAVNKTVCSLKQPEGKVWESLNRNSKNHLKDQSTSVPCPKSQSDVVKESKENFSQSCLSKCDDTSLKKLQNREIFASPITFESPLFTSTQTFDIRNSTTRNSSSRGHAAQSSTPVRFRQSFSNQYGKWGLSPKPEKTDHNPVALPDEFPKFSSPKTTYVSSTKRCFLKSRQRNQRVPSAQKCNKKHDWDYRSAAGMDDNLSDEPEISQAMVDLTRTPTRMRRKRVDANARNNSKLRHSSSKCVERLECSSSKQLRDDTNIQSSHEERRGCVFDEKVQLDKDTVNRWLDGAERFHSTNIPGFLSIDGHLSLSNRQSNVDDKSSTLVNIHDESVSDYEENACPVNYEWSWEQRQHFTSWWINTAYNDDKYSNTCDNSSLHFDPFTICENKENCPLRATFDQSSSMTLSVVQDELQERNGNIDVLFDGQELLCLSSKSAKSEKRIRSHLLMKKTKQRFFLVNK